VRVIYTDHFSQIKSTNIAEGDFPEWNQVLEFPLMPEKKGECFTVKELEKSKTVIMISVFDKLTQFYKDDEFGVPKMSEVHRFLGSFSIPLSTILQNAPKLEGQFKLNMPLQTFDYEVLDKNPFIYSS
jgi:hypothetical protein